MSILPFHLEDSQHGLNLSMALAVCLLFAAVCFFSLELSALVGVRGSGSSYTRLLLGVVSAATGLAHIVRTWLTEDRMKQYHAKGMKSISLHDVALLSRTHLVLSASLLLLITLKFAQQLRFVRHWAVFGNTFQKLSKELLGLVLLISTLLLLLTTCIRLVPGALSPTHSISFTTCLLHALWSGPRLWSMLNGVPGLGWMGLGMLVVCRALLWGSVLSIYRCTRAESCHLALEPQDHEMIGFLVKRFKLWLGVNKVKEYRHSVKFQGLESSSTRSPATSSILSTKTFLSNQSSSVDQEDPVSPTSLGPPLSHALAVEHLPRAITALLNRMDKVTLVLQEVSNLEQRLQLWQIKQQSMKLLRKETHTPTIDKQLLLSNASSTFSESALTRIKSKIVKSNSYRFSPLGAPLTSGLIRHAASAGMCSRTQVTTRRPQSQETSAGCKQSVDLVKPFPQKRRAWDSDKPGDVVLQTNIDQS